MYSDRMIIYRKVLLFRTLVIGLEGGGREGAEEEGKEEEEGMRKRRVNGNREKVV